MNVLHLDLDNTLIYSYKKNIGQNVVNVEVYQDREISFITQKTHDLLCKVHESMLVVPTTTRTIEQYNRIQLEGIKLRYALVCNGGVLLVDGVRDQEWYGESLAIVSNSISELEKAMQLLEKERNRYFELRFIEELFIFTKCTEPEAAVNRLKLYLDIDLVDVFHNGDKVYVVPAGLTKGRAVERFQKRFLSGKIFAAGDSEFDISMLQAADMALVPHGFAEKYGIEFKVEEAPEDVLFSEYFLERIQPQYL